MHASMGSLKRLPDLILDTDCLPACLQASAKSSSTAAAPCTATRLDPKQHNSVSLTVLPLAAEPWRAPSWQAPCQSSSSAATPG
jgi:hypothetical protein